LAASALFLRRENSISLRLGLVMGFSLDMLIILEPIRCLTLRLLTFDETMPCTSLGFECAGDEDMAEDLFEEKDEAGDDDGENHAPEAECVHTTSPTTTTEGGPSTSWTTTVRQED
jgi:hypothetical protein